MVAVSYFFIWCPNWREGLYLVSDKIPNTQTMSRHKSATNMSWKTRRQNMTLDIISWYPQHSNYIQAQSSHKHELKNKETQHDTWHYLYWPEHHLRFEGEESDCSWWHFFNSEKQGWRWGLTMDLEGPQPGLALPSKDQKHFDPFSFREKHKS